MKKWLLFIVVVIVVGVGLLYYSWPNKVADINPETRLCEYKDTGQKYVCNQVVIVSDDKLIVDRVAIKYGLEYFMKLPEMSMYGLQSEDDLSSEELGEVINSIETDYDLTASYNFIDYPQ